jgi:hypothetical protein
VAKSTTIECHHRGNVAFSGKLSKPTDASFSAYLGYLQLIHKARAACAHFGVNPAWSVAAFDRDTREKVEQLYAVLFEGGWKASRPRVKLTAALNGKTINYDVLQSTTKPGLVAFTGLSDNTWELLGEELNVGRLVYELTDVSAVLAGADPNGEGDVPVKFTGTDKTTMAIRIAGADDPKPDP